jgi:hypothetical protein
MMPDSVPDSWCDMSCITPGYGGSELCITETATVVNPQCINSGDNALEVWTTRIHVNGRNLMMGIYDCANWRTTSLFAVLCLRQGRRIGWEWLGRSRLDGETRALDLRLPMFQQTRHSRP